MTDGTHGFAIRTSRSAMDAAVGASVIDVNAGADAATVVFAGVGSRNPNLDLNAGDVIATTRRESTSRESSTAQNSAHTASASADARAPRAPRLPPIGHQGRHFEGGRAIVASYRRFADGTCGGLRYGVVTRFVWL